MTQYLLCMYQPGGAPPPPEALEPVMRKVRAIIQDLKAQQLWVFNGALHPVESATVVRKEHGKLVTIDGPYAESKEHIGGVMVIKANDLDAALKWAGRLADAVILEGHDRGLSVEVRPFQQGN
jgi:hypothetical protein